ncbi:MAG: hypothetical protein ABJE95_29315 [Byssovorax sp.]
MRTSTTTSSLVLLGSALAACGPATAPDATPPIASPTTPATPTAAPTVVVTAAPTATAVPTATPTSTAIPRPEMPATGPVVTTFDAKVDREPLLKLGCKVNGDALVCGTAGTPKGDGLTCGEYSQPNDLLGALTPKAPITSCDTLGKGLEVKGIYRSGCRLSTWHRYVVADGKKLVLLDTKDAFVKRFAPVETAAEALAFAVALTDSKALFKIELPKDAQVFLKSVDPTSVTPVADGFKVRLYGYQFCGCGPHNHLAVDYLVTRAGEIRELESAPAWNDPKTAKLCVD